MGTISKAFWCVEDSWTWGAQPSWWACKKRPAQRHQWSPGFRPGKPNSGCGVLRSFPRYFENAKNSAVITAQTVWLPLSSVQVLHDPSLKNPVSGFWEQPAKGRPITLISISFCIVLTFKVGPSNLPCVIEIDLTKIRLLSFVLSLIEFGSRCHGYWH